MANHVSSLKRARQTETKTAGNRSNKSKLRGTLRLLREAIAEGDHKTVAEHLQRDRRPSWTRACRRVSCTRTPPAVTRPASTPASRPSSRPAKPRRVLSIKIAT